ncbi:MAG: hypothetical protein L0Y61_05950 [Epsilonproteobacteria bacterium]|nr:hypothetical protein [Campylobacterota bacterium]
MNNNIRIDYEDYQTIFSHQGRIDGLVGNYKLDNLFDYIPDAFKESIQNAKGVLIKFSMNSATSILTIVNFLEKINTIIDDNCDAIFGSKINDSLDVETVNVTIILTGLDLT